MPFKMRHWGDVSIVPEAEIQKASKPLQSMAAFTTQQLYGPGQRWKAFRIEHVGVTDNLAESVRTVNLVHIYLLENESERCY